MRVFLTVGIAVLAGLAVVVFVVRKLGSARKEIEVMKNDTDYV